MTTKAPEILFNADGSIELLTGGLVVDFRATAQRAMLNLLAVKGRDKVFPKRGTDLLVRALGGSLLNLRAAQHAGNFAASDTLFFTREFDVTESSSKLSEMRLSVATLSLDLLDLQAGFLSVGGENLSFTITNALTN